MAITKYTDQQLQPGMLTLNQSPFVRGISGHLFRIEEVKPASVTARMVDAERHGARLCTLRKASITFVVDTLEDAERVREAAAQHVRNETAHTRATDKAEADRRTAVISALLAGEVPVMVPPGGHCTTCQCIPAMAPAIRFDLSPAAADGKVRDHLIAMGWTPPGEQAAPLVAVRPGAIGEPATVAALGIDLEQFREAVQGWRDSASNDQADGRISRTEWFVIADRADRLLALIDASPKGGTCGTCNGHGMIGGLLPAGGGYESEPCPDCSPKGGSDASNIPEPFQECYSTDGDSWLDCPDDAEFVDGLAVGDTYTVVVSHYSVERIYRVTKAPDETSDDYAVEPVQATSAEVKP